MKSPKATAVLILDALYDLPDVPTKESIVIAKVLLELMPCVQKEAPTEWIYFNGHLESAMEYLESYAGIADAGSRTPKACAENAASHWHTVLKNIDSVLEKKTQT